VKSTRCTNPIAPTYTVETETKGKTEEIGFVTGSKPSLFGTAPLPNYDNATCKVKDIIGA